GIHRVHLEEDAAKLVHVGESGRIHGSDRSVVDFNRGGTPLVEVVTEPDLRSAEQAHEWLTLLRTTLRQPGASDGNMEEGRLRARSGLSRSWACIRCGRAIWPSGASWPTTSSGRWPPRPTVRLKRSRCPTGSRSWWSGSAPTPTPRKRGSRPRRWPRWWPW